MLALVWLLSGLIFLILIISLGFQPKFMNKLLGGIFLFVGICGLGFYGYGYFRLYGGLVSLTRTVFSVFCMFLGRNDIGTISKAAPLDAPPFQILIYTTHLLALYSTASAVVTNVGARVIRQLSLLLLRHKQIHLFYGANEDSLNLAAALQKQDKNAVSLFVDDTGAASLESRIFKMGSLLMTDDAALVPGTAFLKKIGMKPGSKQLSVYALKEDPNANLRYARALQTALREAGIRPEQCRLTLISEDERNGAGLQAGEASDGAFSSVQAIEQRDLLARLLIKEFPPCNSVRFQENGRADENFEAMIVGFGRTGRAVLRHLIMNGQFAGSHFHALIITKDYTQSTGSFFSRYAGLKDRYDLEFVEDNARSLSIYRYLEEHISDMNYIVICTGNDRTNNEIAKEYADLLESRGSKAVLVQCSDAGITSFEKGSGLPKTIRPYTPEVVCDRDLDRMAVQINHRYHLAEGHSAEEDWAACDYFSRMSCRASADYFPAFLKASGLSAETLKTSGWPDNAELLYNLGQMEHERWCAFHYCMGYQPMSEEEWQKRAERFLSEKAASGHSSLRIGKDTAGKKHACLIPWDKLPELDKKEEAVTGKKANYQQMDMDNVQLIPQLLRESRQEE